MTNKLRKIGKTIEHKDQLEEKYILILIKFSLLEDVAIEEVVFNPMVEDSPQINTEELEKMSEEETIMIVMTEEIETTDLQEKSVEMIIDQVERKNKEEEESEEIMTDKESQDHQEKIQKERLQKPFNKREEP